MYSNLAQSQIVFHMNEQPLVPDHGIQYKEQPSSHHEGMKVFLLLNWSTDG